MKLIWTYDVNSKKLTKTNRIILTNYYILSINRAKQFGYYTIMYCSLSESKFWSNIVDEVISVTNYENSPLWDSFKFKVLEERQDEFCLIDGDVILHNRLPEFNSEVVFDSYEILNWKIEYEPTINDLTQMGIKSKIEFWNSDRVNVTSCGILYIKNEVIRKLYVNIWKDFNEFVLTNQHKIDTYRATAVGAQFLLTLMVKHFELPHKNLSSNFGDRNEFYQHYFGEKKYISPLVPIDNIIGKDFQIKLF